MSLNCKEIDFSYIVLIAVTALVDIWRILQAIHKINPLFKFTAYLRYHVVSLKNLRLV